jgi:hypothetical protein
VHAHLAQNHRAVGREIFDDPHPGVQRRQTLRLVHRRCMREIRGAHAEFAIEQLRMSRKHRGDARIDHRQRRAELSRQHANRSAAGQEIVDHLRSDRGWISRDTFGDDAVVASEHQHLSVFDFRRQPALHARDPGGQRLQFAQRSRWFGFCRQFALDVLGEVVARIDRIDHRRLECSESGHEDSGKTLV